MKKLKMHSPDLTAENIAKIRELFPGCVTEAVNEDGKPRLAVDFDQLRQELSDSIVEGAQERYRLDWPGKRAALLSANAPIAKTLCPCREESVDFDSTKNLFIEGDNLDALKLLQETWLGKIKMIYIDPPYNTGKDFIYKDNFSVNKQDYLKNSRQIDKHGGKLVSNPESNGRYHSDWLSMMYPRLKLARNLLRDDGVIFISIDDGEQENLKKIVSEVFGQENFEGHIHWRRRPNQPNDPTKMIGLVAEHILVFAKNKIALKEKGVGKVELTGAFSNGDNDPRGDWASKPWKAGSDQSGSRYKIKLPNGVILDEEWMGEEETYKKLLEDNRIIFSKHGKGTPRKKYFRNERENEGQCATNWWTHEQFGHNQEGNSILTELMDGIKNTFSNPKPPKLIRNFLALANTKPNDIILDFFAGSATTAHATMQLNAKDGGNRKFIMAQLPEKTDEKSEACKAGYKTIAEISKERIRRAGKKILASECHKNWNKDIGFRVLKIDSSNMAEVFYTPQATAQGDLLTAVDNIKPGRDNPEDLLFQVLVDWGVDLTLPIRRETIQNKTVFFVNHAPYDLIACFDLGITEQLVKELATHKPARVVFRDNGFASDAVKINTEQIFRQLASATEVKSI